MKLHALKGGLPGYVPVKCRPSCSYPCLKGFSGFLGVILDIFFAHFTYRSLRGLPVQSRPLRLYWRRGTRMIRFWKLIRSIDNALSGLLLGAMILLGFGNVISRYFLNASLAASEEILTFALVFIALLASAPGVKRDSHVGMSILVTNRRQRFVPILSLSRRFPI